MFSVNLNLTKLYILTEECFSKIEITETFIEKAFFRYEMFLDLKMKHPDVILIPTFDIELIWCSHMLRPSLYYNDCFSKFGQLVQHKMGMTDYERINRDIAILETKELWEDIYKLTYFEKQIENSSFDFDVGLLDENLGFLENCEVHNFDLDINFKKSFSITFGDVMEDRKFYEIVENAKPESYLEFLELLGRDRNKIGKYSPNYQTDVFWHIHMLHPIEYFHDSMKFFGFLLDHHQSSNLSKK
jgi:hypothetical protein